MADKDMQYIFSTLKDQGIKINHLNEVINFFIGKFVEWGLVKDKDVFLNELVDSVNKGFIVNGKCNLTMYNYNL